MTFYPSIKARTTRYPTIHDDNNLDSQGYGALSDCISCDVTEELNGGFTLEMKYPLHGIHNEYLTVGNIIMAKPAHNQDIQPFRIHQIKRSFGNSINVYANHISYDLSGYPMTSAQTYNSLADVISAMNNASWNTGSAIYHQFTFKTDKTSSATFSIAGTQTLRSWMGGQEGSILDTYGGEWSYDNFKCFLASRRGEDTGIRISYGKNLAEYEKQKDNSVYSHVCAYWKNGDDTKASDVIATGANCNFRVAYIDVSKEFESAPTTAQLNTSATSHRLEAAAEFQSITVTPAQVGEVIGLGDSVLICYEGVFQTRVVKTVWDALAGVYKTLELGDKKAGIADTIKTVTSSPSEITDYVVERGTSSGWTYKKWASGVYECWRRDSKTANIDQTWGNLSYGTLSAYTYPITFVGDYPVINITVQTANGGAWAVPNYSDYSFTSTGTIYLYRPSAISNMNVTVNIHAAGRWKN